MNETDRAHLRAGATALGVPLSDEQIAKLDRYVALLLSWNERLNLTAVTAPRAIVEKHLLDSLALVPHLAGETLLDVGTGAGLPSVVLAIVRPTLAITAVESIHKKVAFVRTVSRELGLSLRVEAVRLETWRHEPTFDVAVSRATFDPAEWVERGATFVAPGGRLIAMLSAQQTAPPPSDGFDAAMLVRNQIGDSQRILAVYRRSQR